MYLGSWGLYDYITFTCNTHTPSTGDATDADAVPTYRIYKEDNATPIATGNMALLDASNTTGFYEAMVQIHPTAGFVKGFTYLIHIAATVGGIDGSMSHTFQIGSVADLEYIDGVVIATGTAQLGVNVVTEADIDFGALKKTSINARTLPTADYFDHTSDEVSADITKISGDSIAADNLELDYDGTGYNKSNSEIGTCAVNTDMIGTAGANTVVPDVAGTAAALHVITDAKIDGLEDLTVADIKAGISDGTYDLEEMMRLMFATLCGKVSGGGSSTITIRDGPDTKDRVITTVDIDGNRPTVVLDGT